jgi:AcrR family transcriptional regulator
LTSPRVWPNSTSERPPPRRGGRPTLAEAAQLERDIRAAALALFLELGYEGTSLDAVAVAAGTTKATLYARFGSKEALFVAVLHWATQRSDWPVAEPPPPDPTDVAAALTEIAHAAARRALHPSMIKLGRIAIAHAERFPKIARQASAVGTWPRRQMIVDLLRHHAATGAIVADDPEILAEHFMAMVSGTPARLASFGVVHSESARERRTRVAVELFVRGLRPD